MQINSLEEDKRNKNETMKNVSSKKEWKLGMTQAHVKTPMITFIMGTYGGKSYKYLIKIKLRRDHTSIMSDIYSFRVSLFDNGKS